MINSIQECREVIADKGGKMRAHNGTFMDSLEQKYDKIKAGSSHPSDFRRLCSEVKAEATKLANKDDWKADRDQPAYDGLMAWNDLLEIEIQNLVIATEVMTSAGKTGDVNGWFNAKTREPIKVYKPAEKMFDNAGGNGVGIGALLNGLMTGAKSDTVKAALESGTDTAGGYTVPDYVTREFIDKLRSASVFVQAGARTMQLEGQTRIVRIDGDPTATWRSENEAINQDDPLFGAINMDPHSLSVMVKVPYELLADSVNVAEILETTLVNSMALKLDQACMFGIGSGNEPLGVYNISGINQVSMGTNGATPSNYDNLLDLLYELELDNVPMPTAAIWHPRTARTYRKMKDTTNQPLVAPEPIASIPKLSTTSVPIDQTQGTASEECSTVVMGDFSQAILGIREELVITRLDQTYAGNGQVGFWARLRADTGFAHAESFARLIGVKA